MEYLLTHDVGTSGDKAVLYTRDGRLVAEAFSGYSPDYPGDKWAGQDSGASCLFLKPSFCIDNFNLLSL
jgi:xylulokinase